MPKIIPYGRQHISSSDINEVIKVLYSDFLTQGPTVPKFEHKLQVVTKSKYATAVNSATSALHIACLALDVGPNDLVWTVSYFVASANCALYCGARVDFIDIDPYVQFINRNFKKISEIAEKSNDLPKVVIPVHLTGEPCDMAAIKDLSLKFGFKIIEDASHAIGGFYQKTP